MVGEYLRHQYSSRKLLVGLDNFVKNAALLTEFEKHLTDSLSLQLQLAAERHISRKPMHKVLVRMEHCNKQVTRVSIVKEIMLSFGFPPHG